MRFSAFTRQSGLISKRLVKVNIQIQEIASQYTDLNIPQAIENKLAEYLDVVIKRTDEFDSFVERVTALEDISDSQLNEISALQDQISDLTISAKASIKLLVPNIGKPADLNVTNLSHQSETHKTAVKLPRLALPIYNGILSNWTNFYNIYNTTIHQNDSLSSVEKFTYLLSYLEGEPLNIIKSLPISHDNYRVAWDTLCGRYQNVRRLVSFHINKILDMPSIETASLKNIRQFLDTYSENSQALKALNYDISQELTLLTVLLRKLDTESRKRFEDKRTVGHNMPTIKELTTFLTTECIHLEDSVATLSGRQNMSNLKTNIPKNSNSAKQSSDSIARKVYNVNTSYNASCIFCKKPSHKIYNCHDFKQLTVNKRLDFIKNNRYCVNCLSNLHSFSQCQSTNTCLHCKSKHHTLLHLNSSAYSDNAQTSTSCVTTSQCSNRPKLKVRHPGNHIRLQESMKEHPIQQNNTILSNRPTLLQNSEGLFTLLGTVKLLISSNKTKSSVVTGLLDSGSQSSIVSTRLCKYLGLHIQASCIKLNGISNVTTGVKGFTKINISTLNNVLLKQNHSVIVLDNIASNLPKWENTHYLRSQLTHLKLADPNFNNPDKIDFLIGADLFTDFITGQIIPLGHNLPTALGTIFGYALIGTMQAKLLSQNTLSLFVNHELNLNQVLQQFWANEEPPILKKTTLEEITCENQYTTSISRESNGRYIASLPFKNDPTLLGNSFDQAKRRFLNLEKTLNSNPKFKTAYTDFINDYIKSGHMTSVDDSIQNSPNYFLPHHAVFKNSSTTKLRVVFDASAKTTNGNSLNDILHCGPKLQNDIFDIIFQFRRYNIVFSCDIRQMYRQIKIAHADQNYQLIIWRENSTLPLTLYKLTTVTYGVKSAPYLAIRTLNELVQDEGLNFPLASQVIKTNIYVDDIVTGSHDVPSALTLQQELVAFLEKGQFQLRKWSSNAPELLTAIPDSHRETPLYFNSPDQPLFSILGLKWTPTDDVFSYAINIAEHAYTKRSILSVIAHLYDPCGWLSPITFHAKCIIQLLWSIGVDWDEKLPENIVHTWTTLVSDMHSLEKIKLPRCLDLYQAQDIQLHGFCDASEQGYAAIVYLRVIHNNTAPKLHILIAKSKVAPLKRISLPRLELCGAHLLAKLLHYCQNLLAPYYKINFIRCWTDSSVTLAWIKTPSYKLKVYVANRVSQIQDWVSPEHWSHVSSCYNPADCATRNISPSALVNHPLWWTGPIWLKHPVHEWPKSLHQVIDTLPEIRTNPLHIGIVSTSSEWDLLTRYSNWTTLKRILAYILRFVNNCKTKIKLSGPLSATEIKTAEIKIIKLIQHHNFSEEIQILNHEKSRTSKLHRLSPFLDNNQILRVGGRLPHSSLQYDAKHPVILPKKHHVTTLLINYYHLTYLHIGPQLLQSLISQHFWILSARSVIRTCIFKCIVCFRAKPSHTLPLMGNLPRDRVTPARPFSKTGVDFAGPFLVKIHTLRNAKKVKVYLCIFVCFATKAVHLEVAMDLSTDAYIDALTRFISRRGLCSDIYSDCGTNFTGAASKLNSIARTLFKNSSSKNKISSYATKHNISFHFLPPAAPHQGGLWESAVKSAKHHLTRILKEQCMFLMDFVTLTTRVEAILNSRPLTPLSSDPTELTVLTPGHFLIGQPLLALPEEDVSLFASNRLKHFQQVQRFTQLLWKRWSLEYLHTLQQRSKWTSPSDNLKIGDLVLILDHNARSMSWPLGRITLTHPGKDGAVRVVTVKTATGTYSRPVTKVFKLPLEDSPLSH